MASWLWGPNRQMFDKFVKIVREEMADVKFIFESSNANNDQNVSEPPTKKIAREGEAIGSKDIPNVGDNNESVIEILAHKKVLAASSPVFNAMFNGEFKESRDVNVKIDDVSPDAFREFLEIFYNDEVILTMKHLEEVMKLIDKYDVKEGWPIVSAFFKKSLAVADILWGLHLAVKFRRDELIVHCTNVIEENCAAVCNMIQIDDNCKPKLCSNPNNRSLTDADLANIYSRVYASIKKNISKPISTLSGVVSLILKCSTSQPINQIENISFSSNRALLLTHLKYPLMFAEIPGGHRCFSSYDIKVYIAGRKSTHTVARYGETIKFLIPISIQANQMYTIQTSITNHPFSLVPIVHAYKTPSAPIQVAPDIQITFEKECSSSIVAAMNFLRYD